MSKPPSPTFASLVQEFFTDYMLQQRALSPRTVASYRDTFVLMLRYAQQQGKAPNSVELIDAAACAATGAPCIGRARSIAPRREER